MLGNEVVGSKQEAASAAGGVADGHSWLGPHNLNDCFDKRARGKVLAGTAFDIFSVFLQKSFVNFALNVYVQANPGFGIDKLNKALELGWILNPALGFAEDNAEHACLFAQGFEDVSVDFASQSLWGWLAAY
jgi:hypothetical protein